MTSKRLNTPPPPPKNGYLAKNRTTNKTKKLITNELFSIVHSTYFPFIGTTVEPLKKDPPRKGHCIKYLSTMDKTKSPNFISPINIMRLEPLKEDNLYTGDKPLEFILVPTCPLLRGSTVSCFHDPAPFHLP